MGHQFRARYVYAINRAFRAREQRMENLDKLVELLLQLKKTEFTGAVTINFSQGGVGRVEKFEEIKIKKQ